jgi:transcription factor C subunit 6
MAGRRPKKKAIDAALDPSVVKTAAWSSHVGVHCVAWHNGGSIGRAGWVASGTAAGLGRVEVVKGRWKGGVVPPDLA